MDGKTANDLYLSGKYVSYHKRVNKGPGGTIDDDALMEVLDEMEGQGWKKIEINQLKLNQQIRYIKKDSNDNHKFVAGGFVRKIDLDNKSISYLSGKIWGVYFDDITDLWARDGQPRKKREKTKGEKKENIPKFKRPVEGKYEVKIDDIVVFRTDSVTKYQRFINTKKFIKAFNSKKFEFKD